MEEDQPTGYILEVDLDYPVTLHSEHSSFPLAPERVKVSKSMLSSYALKSYEQIYCKPEVPSSDRLTATLLPKSNYVVHYMTLQLYLLLGLRLKKVHKVLEFTQSRFLKPYVDFCTSKRASSTSKFKEKLWKLCVNSCFGKFIESVRKYKKCSIVTDPSTALKKLSTPFVERAMIINQNCVLIMERPQTIYLNKPITIGFSILDRSKEFMYKSFYTFIKPKFSMCKVLFSDTDSLCLEVSTSLNESPISLIRDIMDFSNYPLSHPLYDHSRKNQLFYFKDELKGEKIIEFVGLRAKCYAFKSEKDHLTRKLKSVTRSYIEKFSFDHYLDCLRQICKHTVTQYHIRSVNHSVTLDQVKRVALSSYDNNRWLLPCGIHSIPYGSIFIRLGESHNKCSLKNKINLKEV